ncbi:SdiA-regulated [compost metagenome]
MKFLFLVFASVLIVQSQATAQSAPVGRLAQYSKVAQTINLPEIGGNLSGITFNYDTGTYFLIQNNYGQMFEYDRNFKRLRVIKLINLEDDDTEGIVYLGKGQFAISSESNLILVINVMAGQTVVDCKGSRPDVQVFTLPSPDKDNKGLEGVCYSTHGGKGAGVFYAVQENKPKRVFKFDRPLSTSDMRYRDLGLKEPYAVESIFKHRMSDLSDCVFDDSNSHLIVLSHESSRLMEIESNSNVVKTFDIPAVAPQYEGVTIGAEGELVLVSEPNMVVILK